MIRAFVDITGTINILFDRNTNTPSATCAELFANASSLGGNAICAWKNATFMTITFGNSPTFIPGQTLTLVSPNPILSLYSTGVLGNQGLFQKQFSIANIVSLWFYFCSTSNQ